MANLPGTSLYEESQTLSHAQREYLVGHLMGAVTMTANGFMLDHPDKSHADWALSQFEKALIAAKERGSVNHDIERGCDRYIEFPDINWTLKGLVQSVSHLGDVCKSMSSVPCTRDDDAVLQPIVKNITDAVCRLNAELRDTLGRFVGPVWEFLPDDIRMACEKAANSEAK